MFLSTAVLLLAAGAAPLPDAPQPRPKLSEYHYTAPSPKPAGFFTFRQSWEAPALRPNKKSWALFIAAHAALGITYAVDYKRTHGVRETPGSEVPAMLGISALDFAAFKLISPSFAVGPPVYAIQHYARDAAK